MGLFLILAVVKISSISMCFIEENNKRALLEKRVGSKEPDSNRHLIFPSPVLSLSRVAIEYNQSNFSFLAQAHLSHVLP